MALLNSVVLRTEKVNEAARCDNAQRSFDDFHIVATVGRGTYGQVYKALDSSTRQYQPIYLLTDSENCSLLLARSLGICLIL